MVESENRSSWEWFLRNLRHAIPEVSTDECTFVSDRDKGLLEAEAVLGPRMVTAWCCYHLKTNFTEKFGRALSPLFWRVARASSEATYNVALKELRERKAEAACWLEGQDPTKWAEWCFPGRRYGHDTSNITESLNQVLRFDRELPITELLDAIWHRVMAKRSRRLLAAQRALANGASITPWVEAQVEAQRLYAQANTVQISSPTSARVVEPNNQVHIVDLRVGTCTCRRFQANGIPCGHAMAFILRIGNQLTPYLPPILSAANWAATYAVPLPPMDITDLQIGEACHPPVTRVPRGRPKKERVSREDARRPRGRRHLRDHGGMLPLGAVVAVVPDLVRHRCSTCGDPGHNARRCRRPHH